MKPSEMNETKLTLAAIYYLIANLNWQILYHDN